jgi:hypothetical protein
MFIVLSTVMSGEVPEGNRWWHQIASATGPKGVLSFETFVHRG